jgi:hypothetical protein
MVLSRNLSGTSLPGFATDAGGGASYWSAFRSNGSLASRTAITSGDNALVLSGYGYTGSYFDKLAQISIACDGGTISPGSVSGRIVFATTPTGTATSVERIRIDNAGKLLSYQMYGGYTIGGTNKAVYIDNSNVIGVLSSSIRTKQDVVDMEDISWIDSLRPVNFAYRSTPGVKQYGLIAEEVLVHNQALVGFDAEGIPDSVSYDRLVPVLLKAVKDLRKEISTLKIALTEL